MHPDEYLQPLQLPLTQQFERCLTFLILEVSWTIYYPSKVIWLIKPMQCIKRVTHLTSNISSNPLWNVCTQDRCQKDINRQLLENFSFATVDKSIIQTVLPVIWQSVHRPRFRHLQLFILNSNKLSVTKRHINIYQLQTFQSYVTKNTSELISTNHLRFSSWVQGLSVVTFSVK